MTVMWDVQERTCAICGRVFIPKAPHAKYCSEACRREHDLRRVKEARRKGAKPKLDRGRPLFGRLGRGARRDHGHAARGRDEILSFRR